MMNSGPAVGFPHAMTLAQEEMYNRNQQQQQQQRLLSSYQQEQLNALASQQFLLQQQQQNGLMPSLQQLVFPGANGMNFYDPRNSGASGSLMSLDALSNGQQQMIKELNEQQRKSSKEVQQINPYSMMMQQNGFPYVGQQFSGPGGVLGQPFSLGVNHHATTQRTTSPASTTAESTTKTAGLKRPASDDSQNGARQKASRLDSPTSTGKDEPKPVKSKYRGVSWHRRDKSWTARIWKDGKSEHLGTFPTELRAALAVDIKALEYFGESCTELNFPDHKERKRLIWALIEEPGDTEHYESKKRRRQVKKHMTMPVTPATAAVLAAQGKAPPPGRIITTNGGSGDESDNSSTYSNSPLSRNEHSSLVDAETSTDEKPGPKDIILQARTAVKSEAKGEEAKNSA